MRRPAPWLIALMLVSGCGLGGRVEVGPGELRVRLGWAFRLTAPRGAVRRAWPDDRRFYSRGVHLVGGGAWLVNTAGSPLVTVDLAPAPRGRVLGWPVRVHQLTVSPADADALLAALDDRPPSAS